MTCEHIRFHADVSVNTVADIGRHTASIRIKCSDCGRPMRFIGLPIGTDLNSPTVNQDGTEAHLPIHGLGEKVPGLQDEGPASFRIRDFGGDDFPTTPRSPS
jgi:hypothetical protein